MTELEQVNESPEPLFFELEKSVLAGLKREYREWLKTASEQDLINVGFCGKLKWRYDSPTRMVSRVGTEGDMVEFVSGQGFRICDRPVPTYLPEPEEAPVRVNPLLVGLDRHNYDEDDNDGC